MDEASTGSPTIYSFNNGSGTAFYGVAQYGNGVTAYSYHANGVEGRAFTGAGVYGETAQGPGVYGVTASGYGVRGQSNGFGGVGVYGEAPQGTGVYGQSNVTGVYGGSPDGTGVEGYSETGLAGNFRGNVNVTGTLTKAAGSFKIDHPLHPADQYLSHSFVESPEMKNIYDGLTVLDERGEATVELPAWFEALNQDFRYQLTAVGGAAPGLHIAHGVQDNRFSVAGGTAGLEVSWQVTGVRHDAYARQRPIPVEEDKSRQERGYYLHPEVFGQPASRAIALAPRR